MSVEAKRHRWELVLSFHSVGDKDWNLPWYSVPLPAKPSLQSSEPSSHTENE